MTVVRGFRAYLCSGRGALSTYLRVSSSGSHERGFYQIAAMCNRSEVSRLGFAVS